MGVIIVGVDLASKYECSIGFWNYFDSVVLFGSERLLRHLSIFGQKSHNINIYDLFIEIFIHFFFNSGSNLRINKYVFYEQCTKVISQ
jgi:hypothetical protein